MMTGRAIAQLSVEAAVKAAKLNQEPLMAFTDGDENIFNMPNLGDYVPDGWKLVEQLFVDKSGFGSPGEPALTVEQFISKVEEGFGYAIIEEGQFQIYVGVFKKK